MSERFARHALIPGWSQSRLTAATAVVVGVGALGNEVARVLAQSGVGRLILCDPDRVSASNLSRTVLFRDGDVGRLKVEAAAEALASLAPGVRVDARPARLTSGVGLAELRDAGVVVGCLDSRSARLQLAGRCGLVRAGWVDGGTHPWGGEVRPYLDPDGPCYGCGLSARERSESDAPWSCLDPRPAAEEGSSAAVSAVVGSLLALVAVRHLLGLPTPTEVLSVDAAGGTVGPVRVPRDPECPYHLPLGPAEVVSAGTVGELRAAVGAEVEVWEPVQRRAECGCGYAEERWRVPRAEACPRCGRDLLARTGLTLEGAPDGMRLAELGVAPREVLVVRGGMRVVELRG